jgi:hypothetical protein
VTEQYVWRVLYDRAVLETDSAKLKVLIAQTEQAIETRLSESLPPPGTEEAQAINETITALSVLKAERCC